MGTNGQIKNVVVVPGSLADGLGWRKVHDLLTAKGYAITVVQPPMTSLEDATTPGIGTAFFRPARLHSTPTPGGNSNG